MPPFLHFAAHQFTYKEVKQQFGEETHNEFKTILNHIDYYKIDILKDLYTLRDVKRFINILYSHFEKLKEEVNFCDLAVYEIFRLRYPYVVQLIEEKQESIFIYDSLGKITLYEKEKEKDVIKSNANVMNSNIGRFEIIEYINNEKENFKLNDIDISNIKN